MHRKDNDLSPWVSRVSFPTTELWSKLEQDSLPPEIWQEVFARYGSPIYSSLRAMGYDREKADDLTTSFFSEEVFAGRLLEKVRHRGSLRGLLQRALRNHVITQIRRARAKKRGGGSGVSLDTEASVRAASILDPETFVLYNEATAFITGVLHQLRQECLDRRLSLHWELFNARVLRPTFYGEAPVPIPELCRRLNIATAVEASNMIPTVTRRFKNLFRREMERHYGHEANVEEKLQELYDLFAKVETHSPQSIAAQEKNEDRK